MELHQLHVGQRRSSPGRETDRLAVVLISPRARAPPQPGVPARGEHYSVSKESSVLTGRKIERESAEAPAGVGIDQEPGDVLVIAHLDAGSDYPGVQDVDDRPTRPVAREARAAVEVCAEEALVKGAGLQSRQKSPPRGELLHPQRRLRDQDLHSRRIRQSVTLLVGVLEVPLGRVIRITRSQGGIDPAGRQARVRVPTRALGQHDGLNSRFVGSQSCPKSGPTSAEDENGNGPSNSHVLNSPPISLVGPLVADLRKQLGQAGIEQPLPAGTTAAPSGPRFGEFTGFRLDGQRRQLAGFRSSTVRQRRLLAVISAASMARERHILTVPAAPIIVA